MIKRQTIVHKTLQRKQKLEQSQPHQEPTLNSSVPEE
jgi:hypothetical protein